MDYNISKLSTARSILKEMIKREASRAVELEDSRSVRYVTSVNEPVEELVDNTIGDQNIEALLELHHLLEATVRSEMV